MWAKSGLSDVYYGILVLSLSNQFAKRKRIRVKISPLRLYERVH